MSSNNNADCCPVCFESPSSGESLVDHVDQHFQSSPSAKRKKIESSLNSSLSFNDIIGSLTEKEVLEVCVFVWLVLLNMRIVN
jgi:hypothetical protein